MSFEVKGDKELAKLFATLGERVQRKVLKQAVNAGASPVLKSAKQKAKKRSGLLRKSLGKKVVANKKTGSVTAIIGARKQVVGEVDGKVYRPSRISHLVEKGYIDEHGNHVPPQPFLNPAMQETEGQALGVMSNKLAAGVVKEASR